MANPENDAQVFHYWRFAPSSYLLDTRVWKELAGGAGRPSGVQ